jgi:two-component system chemotaxis sensor kinase CheA
MEQLRDGAPVTSEAVTLILVTVDRIKAILVELERLREEPPGSDRDLIAALERASGADGTAEADDLDLVDLEDDGSEEAARERLAAEGARLVPALVPSGPMRKPQTIRVGVEAVERLMTMVSELVLTRNQLLDLSKRTDVGHPFKAPLQRLSRVTAELQESVMKTRMQPIGAAWAKLPRVIRDLSADLGKEIDLVMRGAETELDRQVLEIIRDPLTHMVRNAADHGIETPHERRAAGKPERGTIRLHAFHEGGTIRIELSDDGRGLDLDAIRQRAVDTGLIGIADASRMDDDQTAELIFHAGLRPRTPSRPCRVAASAWTWCAPTST